MKLEPFFFVRTRRGIVVREADYKRKGDAVNAARELSKLFGQEVTLKVSARKVRRKLVLKMAA